MLMYVLVVVVVALFLSSSNLSLFTDFTSSNHDIRYYFITIGICAYVPMPIENCEFKHFFFLFRCVSSITIDSEMKLHFWATWYFDFGTLKSMHLWSKQYKVNMHGMCLPHLPYAKMKFSACMMREMLLKPPKNHEQKKNNNNNT